MPPHLKIAGTQDVSYLLSDGKIIVRIRSWGDSNYGFAGRQRLRQTIRPFDLPPTNGVQSPQAFIFPHFPQNEFYVRVITNTHMYMNQAYYHS